MRNKADELQNHLKEKKPEEIISYVAEKFQATEIVFTTSLSNEDQIITHLISKIQPGIEIVTLDTGRLFPETYELIEQTENILGVKIKVLFPDAQEVEQMVNQYGINLFYKSVEFRRLCCNIRKTKPLKKILQQKKVWITGIRQQQSITRYAAKEAEWDELNGIIKINPLLRWSEEQVLQYVKEKQLPYNKLYDRGYKSIGCQPCTRPVKPGEHERAGRWWWENPENKECGLHK